MADANDTTKDSAVATSAGISYGPRQRPAGQADEDKRAVVIVAEDAQFLETIHINVRALTYDYLIASTREEFLKLLDPAPAAILIDLQAVSLEPQELLRLLSTLGVPAKIILLAGVNLSGVADAQRLCAAASLPITGILQRPLKINALSELLDRHARITPALTVDDLKMAIDEHQFSLNYQPIVGREGRRWRVRAAEALIRWQHPQRGVIFPVQFLRLAEEFDLMPQLTDVVIMEAVRQASVWEQRKLDLGVTVNIACSSVRDNGFADRLLRLLREYDVAPSRLTLEMIEAASAPDRALLRENMTRLRLHGVGVSLDDFGTGDASLMEFAELPFNEIKIDRSLISGLEEKPRTLVIVEAMIELAHKLSISVCAEGVERADTFSLLQTAGCDSIQGLLIGKPGTPAEILEFFEVSEYWQPPA